MKNIKQIVIIIILISAIILGIVFLVFTLLNQSSKKQKAASDPLPPISSPTKTPEQQAEAQGASDVYFSAQEKKLLSEYPWYGSLPKRTLNYFVAFDPNSKKFAADIYTNIKSEENVKKDVESFLDSIGANTKKYPVSWNVYSDSPSNPVSE